MSIASEIQRLQTDSTAIANAITAKGVTVPSGSGYDDYASLIASIPQEGGGGNVDPELPSGYTRHAYIQSPGGCAINTGINGAVTWVITVQCTDSSQKSVQFLGQGSSLGQFFGIMSGGQVGLSTNSGQYVSGLSSSAKINATLCFSSNITSGSLNGSGIYKSGSVTRTGTYALLSLTTSSAGAIKAKIWQADAWKGTEHVFHGIPCTRNSDSIGGLYDTISETFLASFGTNDFTAGD